jgi:hypothetical protein
MKRWLDIFLTEKGVDLDTYSYDVEGPSGNNHIPARCVYDAILGAPAHEQAAIKKMLVKIDFYQPGPQSVLDYFGHLAKALAI